MLRKYPSTEWSGVLFITHEGSFENNDLVITCKDIYPMDLGDATFTEFKMNEDVAAYMADNIELFDCDTALIHSHHQMSTQPSGTDINTLREEGNERNCFVSLIVNNAGTYYAAITRKMHYKSEITVKNVEASYEFFGEGTKGTDNNNIENKVIDKEVIEYFDLNVERHEVTNRLSYLDARFEEIEKKKAENRANAYDNSSIFNQKNDFSSYLDNSGFPWKNKFYPKNKGGEIRSNSWVPNPKEIHKAVVHMITCSFITNPEKFDLKQWVTKHMVNVYDRIFGENSYMGTEDFNPFTEWKDFIVQFTLDHFNMDDAPDNILDDMDLAQSLVAEAIIEELSEYNNGYIDSYCEALSLYIIE